ncbi:ribosome maturation factor RimM [Gulosibacter bifidus]|uniref:Ribosome maturation factor RimM n=1 Tax=Gulosibacter bifidus TaxID=272239 RepID=A0ABW5RJ04_9MICO|nr:ribosome maturation factor RimM [Gulosibacter bifidus]
MASKKRSGITQLRVGRLVKAHGLKGAIKLELYTDEPDRRFIPGASFSLQVPATSPWRNQKLVLRELRWFNDAPVGFFEGVTDRTTAETLIKAILWVDQDDAEELDPDTWYDHQLVELDAVVDGKVVGKIARVEHFPAQDLLVIATGNGDVMVPFVKEIVPAVDLEAGIVTITPPGGLFDDQAIEARPAGQQTPAERAAAASTDATASEPADSEPAAASASPETSAATAEPESNADANGDSETAS